jgi:parallel beta-helix repeat protein
VIVNNDIGIVFGIAGTVIESNLIANNGKGILQRSSGSATVQNNNFQNNPYNYYLDEYATDNISIPNNWWGTTDQSAINVSIYDSKNDYSLGTVNYLPILTSPNPQAPTINSLPDSIQPTTENPTEVPQSTATPTPTASSSQLTDAQTIIVPILVGVIVALLIIIALMHTKSKPQTC